MLLLRLLCFLLASPTISTLLCFDNPYASSPPPSPNDLPLCGNGFLDTDELCDDGNRVDGDGCNAYCSAYDAMASTCTLAGSTTTCPFDRSQILSPSQTLFCDLRAIDASPAGDYVILADKALLLRFYLYTDNVASSLVPLSVSVTHGFGTICSLAVLPHDESILVHECSHLVHSVHKDGASAQTLADLRQHLRPSVFRAHYDKNTTLVYVAGQPMDQDAGCIQIWVVSLHDKRLHVTIPCILYNVWDHGILYPSYSIRDMHPHAIVPSSCPSLMLQNACLALSLHREDLQHITIYFHVHGGTDYTATLHSNAFDNALGSTITRFMGTTTFHSRGTCFYAESTLLTSANRIPPPFFLGNACRNVPSLGLPCATPLNNPFVTDIVSSPYLLPHGLSSTHTHQDLTTIFSASSPTFPNITAGPIMYKNTLLNTYGNTTPIDFVPLPHTRDIIYITQTSVGLISTKRNNLYDRANPGYCRATNLLSCPPNSFGTVGDVCASCSNTSHPMHARSVAWQIMCASTPSSARRLLALSSTPPYTRVSFILGADSSQPTVMEDILHDAMATYVQLKGTAAPLTRNTSFLSPMQPYNMLADNQNQHQPTFLETLMEQTSSNLFKNKTLSRGAEYITTILSYAHQLPLLDALRKTKIATPPISSPCTDQTYMLQRDPFRGWLKCFINKDPSIQRRRRLLSTSADPILIQENQAITMASSTAISWNIEKNTNPPPNPIFIPSSPSPASTNVFPMWIAILIAVTSLLIILGLLGLWYYFHKTPKASEFME